MAKVLDMPKLSPTMEEGQISAWHKKEGEDVGVDDLLAEVETDKATMEYRSFDKGTLLKILAPAGSVVKLGQPVAIIGAKGEDVSKLAGEHGGDAGSAAGNKDGGGSGAGSAASTPEASSKDAGSAAGTPDAGSKDAGSAASTPDAGQKKAGSAASNKTDGSEPSNEVSGRVKASPYVRKVARERGLSLAGLLGSGPHGRIIARDLENQKASPQAPAAEAKAPAESKPQAKPSAAAPSGDLEAPEARPLSMMRKAIARRLTESKQQVPHFYLSIDVDADPLHHLREQINGDLASSFPEGQAPKVSFNDLLVKACAIALRRVPECNAQFAGDSILIHKRVDISVAVAVAEGLMTPVVRDADEKSVLQIAGEVRELAGKAKNKKLKPEEMSNGTFSISNLGMYGIDSFAAVINPPEGAILAAGQVRREPVVKGEQVVPGRRLALTLSCDHRVIDGAVGASFLKALRALLEHPTQILL